MTRHLLVSWGEESDTSSCPLWGLDDSHPPTSWTGILILEFYYFLLIYLVFFWKTRRSNSSSISLIIMRVLIKLQWQTEMEYTKLLQNNLAIMRGCVRCMIHTIHIAPTLTWELLTFSLSTWYQNVPLWLQRHGPRL